MIRFFFLTKTMDVYMFIHR